MFSHSRSVAVVITFLALLAYGCSSSSGSSSSSKAPSASSTSSSTASPPSTQLTTATVTIKDFAFGDPVTVKAGWTVTVHNADETAHTVSAADGSFDTMPVFAGKSTTFVAPVKAGTYKFHCNIHANMQGTLVVSA